MEECCSCLYQAVLIVVSKTNKMCWPRQGRQWTQYCLGLSSKQAGRISASVGQCVEAEAYWKSTSRLSFFQFTVLTSLILSDLRKWFNGCFLTEFQHHVGGWSDANGQGRCCDGYSGLNRCFTRTTDTCQNTK